MYPKSSNYSINVAIIFFLSNSTSLLGSLKNKNILIKQQK